jgi:membrane-associated protease RseP (regulator of RpoE activity)
MNNTREQLEMLLSQMGDGRLTEAERRTVESALRDDPQLAALASRYERLEEFLDAMRRDVVRLDESSMRDVVRAALTDELAYRMIHAVEAPAGIAASRDAAAHDRDVLASGRRFAALDALLIDHAANRADVDFAGLGARISRAVRRERTRQLATGGQAAWTRLAGGFASIAAALLVAVVWWSNGAGSGVNSGGADPIVAPVATPTPVFSVAFEAPRSGGKIVVEFDRSERPESIDMRLARRDEQSVVSGHSARSHSSSVAVSLLALY